MQKRQACIKLIRHVCKQLGRSEFSRKLHVKIELQLLYDKCSGPSDLSVEVKCMMTEHFILIRAVVLSSDRYVRNGRAAFDLSVRRQGQK